MTKRVSLALPEKVKILGISGSPRKKGNTSTMVQFCLEGIGDHHCAADPGNQKRTDTEKPGSVACRK